MIVAAPNLEAVLRVYDTPTPPGLVGSNLWRLQTPGTLCGIRIRGPRRPPSGAEAEMDFVT